jgi:hypothetical protein
MSQHVATGRSLLGAALLPTTTDADLALPVAAPADCWASSPQATSNGVASRSNGSGYSDFVVSLMSLTEQ